MQFDKQLLTLLFFLSLLSCAQNASKERSEEKVEADGDKITYYLTKGDRSALLQKLQTSFTDQDNAAKRISLDSTQTFQEIDGFGYTLTGGSADLIASLPEAKQDSLLEELFSDKEQAIRVNYLRVSIGASDLSASTFTYNEMPAGQSDPSLKHFSIAEEKKSLIPVLKKIIAINPAIKILGSPWTAPTWMKTNGAFKGGSLKKEYYASYAQYFVKYIEAMKSEGIVIDAITIQNEPLHPGNTPSMYMEAKDQALFIKTALGPAFEAAGIKTKIIVYDHNADRPDYPMEIYADKEASKYVDGAAFHLYGGKIEALSTVHDAFPDKNLYFTEQWVGGPGNFAEDLKWHVSTLIIGATRNWSRNVLEWNLAADANYNPHTPDGGCTSCLGALTIDGDQVSRNVAFYIIGHASKFVPTGSKRIASTLADSLPNAAFLTPQGKKVLIVVNEAAQEQSFTIEDAKRYASLSLPGESVATFVW
ncbi:glycoside hydrolase family 30 beta sandwich domain-containing protein [Olivibacter sp. XZL3]|uniref:glycoside hydrolase family 30 protein n=1 Tax=Olivibacter sp. XZL3 TaxID=1735116 RepID=UPI0010660F45|nr:glycoside hydrolase family 30 beta sandwich domain-containing protein [Olivibacter sp. XZL3]